MAGKTYLLTNKFEYYYCTVFYLVLEKKQDDFGRNEDFYDGCKE